jgi:hypothetical protein
MTPTICKSTSRHQRALPVTALSRCGDGAEHLAFAGPCAQALVPVVIDFAVNETAPVRTA